jgi:proteasome lid subunit RPN8/RPN11
MLIIEKAPWDVMVAHAESTYPNECCGAMLGSVSKDGVKTIVEAITIENVYEGGQEDRYEIRPEDLLGAERAARAKKLDIIGIFHSHPDCDAYFSDTDLENSCSWYSFLVLSVQKGKFNHAGSFLPNFELTEAPPEELIWPKS